MRNTIYRDGEMYDLEYLDFDADIPMYEELARTYSGRLPVIEYGCGTGRVTIPLARAGFPVRGVDLSPEMLKVAKSKLKSEEPEVSKLVLLDTGDMRFDQRPVWAELVIVPFNAFLHLTKREDQLAALKTFHNHLIEGGHLLVDIFNPDVRHLAEGLSPHSPIAGKQLSIEEGKRTLVRSSVTKYAPASQRVSGYFFIDIYDTETGELAKKRRYEAYIKVIFPEEWRTLLWLSGFSIESEWGNYQQDPFGDTSGKMLFLAKKTHVPLV